MTSRLLSCLVTEQLLRAFYVSLTNPNRAAGVLVILSTHLISEQPVINRSLRSSDIFALVPLRHAPVFNGGQTQHGRSVGLLDPLDMLPEIYELAETQPGDGKHVRQPQISVIIVVEPVNQDNLHTEILACLIPPPWDLGRFNVLLKTPGPLHLWKKFVEGVIIKDSLREVIEKELVSSYDWQCELNHSLCRLHIKNLRLQY